MLLRLLRSARLRRRQAEPSAPSPAPPASGSRLHLLSRLASFASGTELNIRGKEAPVESADRSDQRELPIMEIVARAASLAAGDDALQAATRARVQTYAQFFSAAARPATGINVFVYHVDLPDGEGIDYVDAKFSPQEFDYRYILARFIARVREHCPGAMIYFVTSRGSRYRGFDAPDVAVVELPVEAAHPMYERACALLAYAESSAFTRDTVFLDSDAFVNRSLQAPFEFGFDVGLTYRDGPRLMPVNEGVLFLAARRPQVVRAFLHRRMAVYDRLLGDPFIIEYYGDVRRWRGGQLSLNAVAYGLFPCSPYRAWDVAGARVRLLPCDTYNFAGGEGEASSSLERLDERYVVHFKGPRKYALMFAAQAERTSMPGR